MPSTFQDSHRSDDSEYDLGILSLLKQLSSYTKIEQLKM